MKNTKHESKQRQDKTQNEPQRMGRAQPSAASQHRKTTKGNQSIYKHKTKQNTTQKANNNTKLN